ncbi:asparagine synthase (glutamine-hydrolyzing) [Amylibacter kogurei]|uniref:asparagine synthase (glutamine-hydrolyzing) n=1 Tax=Paramylibacter kogurei TaxID=1889778 RepID=A0A2G5KB71_9RHOB|nr:asparagine synthase (glutamine-hydrolyzing) [Amylibacter kogurei]PIB26756.1 asparagine synthase (glutamine-hydrolyzing) [Amylibacter kogurei]
MCGIAGFTSPRSTSECRNILQRMTDAIAHRGPDGQGHFFTDTDSENSTIALGHRRLSIIDLAAGAQPFHIDDERYSITYNGEIYNYVELREDLRMLGEHFETQSDTEVLLRAFAHWGADCLNRLRGMFSFAIWDKQKQELFMARDPFGKKPLLYFRTDQHIVFGSEFASLVEHPDFENSLNENALAQYLIWKYVPGENTLVDGVAEIPPGHFAIWSERGFTIHKYYTIPDQESLRDMNDDTVAEFREELSEAVRLRLRSDVPLGAFLSGGLDSSALVALMTEISGKPVKTFSIGFEDAEYSETWAARLVAEKYNSDHHELNITPDDYLSQIEPITWQRGAPLSEMADVPLHYLSHLAAKHVKVVLSGEGSDELLAGYPKYWGDNYIHNYQRFTPAPLDGAIGMIHKNLPYKMRRLGVMLRAAGQRDFLDRQASWFGLLTPKDAATLAPDLFANYQPFVWDDERDNGESNLSRVLRFDKSVWLPGTLLERGDRMTMAASIEGRMPFMDTKLCEFVATLPPTAFLDGRVGKNILRLAMKDAVPQAVLDRPKSGFKVPIQKWLRGQLKDYAHELLFSNNSKSGAYYDRAVLHKIWIEHQSQKHNHEKQLWSLMSLEIFLRKLGDHTTTKVAA